MGVQRVTPPEEEPIDLVEAKAHLFLDGTAQDTDIARLIAASRSYVERATGRSLITQGWELTLDRFPCESDPQGSVILLPMGVVQSVEGITYVDEDGDEQTLATSVYKVGVTKSSARIALRKDQVWPETREEIEVVTVAYTAGYGDEASSVPEDLRHAVRVLLGHWHRNREAVVTGTISTAVQHTLDQLLDSFRIDR